MNNIGKVKGGAEERLIGFIGVVKQHFEKFTTIV